MARLRGIFFRRVRHSVRRYVVRHVVRVEPQHRQPDCDLFPGTGLPLLAGGSNPHVAARSALPQSGNFYSPIWRDSMKICVIGGIYAKGGAPSDYLKITPETTLAAGCRAAGHEVTTLSHYDETDFQRFDVVHVHHLSYGALRLATDPSPTPFPFTPHDTS